MNKKSDPFAASGGAPSAAASADAAVPPGAHCAQGRGPAITAGVSGFAGLVAEPRLVPKSSGAARAPLLTGDGELLLLAVRERLVRAGADMALAPRASPDAQLQDVLHDCVTLLDQLHGALRHEVAQRLQLEVENFETQIALQRARAEWRSPQSGD